MDNCIHCGRVISNKGSLKAHEISCEKNPDRVRQTRSPLAGKQKGSIPWNKGVKTGAYAIWREKYPNDEIFVVNSTYGRTHLKKRILNDELIEYKCCMCGIGPVWLDKPMPLVLDHENGINNDNRIENLRFVCSNCDTQLPTYKSKNKGGGVKVTNGI